MRAIAPFFFPKGSAVDVTSYHSRKFGQSRRHPPQGQASGGFKEFLEIECVYFHSCPVSLSNETQRNCARVMEQDKQPFLSSKSAAIGIELFVPRGPVFSSRDPEWFERPSCMECRKIEPHLAVSEWSLGFNVGHVAIGYGGGPDRSSNLVISFEPYCLELGEYRIGVKNSYVQAQTGKSHFKGVVEMFCMVLISGLKRHCHLCWFPCSTWSDAVKDYIAITFELFSPTIV